MHLLYKVYSIHILYFLFVLCAQFAVQFGVDYLSWRFWIGMWTMVFLAVLAIGEVSILIKFFTRFSEEVFTLIVAVFFAYQSGLQLYQVCTYVCIGVCVSGVCV